MLCHSSGADLVLPPRICKLNSPSLIGRAMKSQSIKVPPGSPAWVTEEMIADTIRVWQPYRKEKITEVEALEMLMNVSRLFDALGLTGAAENSVPKASATVRHDDHFEERIRKHLERPDLTPVQEGRLYEIMMMEINPATGKKWTLKEIARHFGKPYSHMRSRWTLVMPVKGDKATRKGQESSDGATSTGGCGQTRPQQINALY